MARVMTLRPGLLVNLTTEVRGNVSYMVQEIEALHITGDGALEKTDQTTKRIADPDEHAQAIQCRSRCRWIILAKLSRMGKFGYMAPLERRAEVEAAIEEAMRVAEAFNASASLTEVDIGAVIGVVMADDELAIRNINKQMRDLLDAMSLGVAKLDADAVRKAANLAREAAAVLSDEARERVAGAIAAARRAARTIAKSGEAAAREIDQAALKTLRTARTAFLDLDAAPEVVVPRGNAPAIEILPEGEPVEVVYVNDEKQEPVKPATPPVRRARSARVQLDI